MLGGLGSLTSNGDVENIERRITAIDKKEDELVFKLDNLNTTFHTIDRTLVRIETEMKAAHRGESDR